MARGLTIKQAGFVEAYLRLQNGGKAYREAYDKTGKMSANMAYVGAWENLRKPKIQEAIKARKEALQALNSVCTVEELAERWTEEIRFDLGELLNEDGTFKSPEQLSRKARRLLQHVKVKETVTVDKEGNSVTELYLEYRLPDRQKAKVELGKRIGFYPAEKSELTVNHNIPKLTPEQHEIAKKLLDEWLERRREAKRAEKYKSCGITSRDGRHRRCRRSLGMGLAESRQARGRRLPA